MPAHAKNLDEIEVAVLIPCYNEATTIAKVVSDFKKELPKAKIYVFDNNSTDGSYDIAKNAGAIVRREYTQGKGAVIRAMFSKIEADIYHSRRRRPMPSGIRHRFNRSYFGWKSRHLNRRQNLQWHLRKRK